MCIIMDIKRLIFHIVFIYIFVCQTLSTFESLSRINKINLLLNQSYRAIVISFTPGLNESSESFPITIMLVCKINMLTSVINKTMLLTCQVIFFAQNCA